MSLLGSIVSAAALISLIQKIGEITISDFLLHLLEYYRSTVRTFVDWIPFPNNFKIPQWYLDLFVVNSFFIGSYLRTRSLLGDKASRRKESLLRILIYSLLLVAIILPIKELISIRRQQRDLKLRNDQYTQEFKNVDLSNHDFDYKDEYYTQKRYAERIKRGWDDLNMKIISESKLYFLNLILIILTVFIFFVCNHNL